MPKKRIKSTQADKALALAVKYSRLQDGIKRWRKKVGLVFGKCERPIIDRHGDILESGCMHELRKHQVNGRLEYSRYDEDDKFLNLAQAMEALDFCRACQCGFRLNAHVKRLRRRRGVTLGLLKRLGTARRDYLGACA